MNYDLVSGIAIIREGLAALKAAGAPPKFRIEYLSDNFGQLVLRDEKQFLTYRLNQLLASGVTPDQLRRMGIIISEIDDNSSLP